MSAQAAPAETIGNYVIERSLAQGSMGHVYVARHQLTYARVALKVLRSELTADTHTEERFLREVRAAAQIGHEGIVKVLDAGCDAHGRLYLAMELLSGETLEDRMSRDPSQRLALMRWIAAALPPLVAAHAQGIIHRDLKPANLFIARTADGGEQLKLLDFGLARDMRQKSRTETGIALGTPYYMSPEQAMRPKEVGPASDVWALGVMMYEVLSGHMPFDGETLHAVVLQSTTRPHMPLATRRPELDPALCELVEDCLVKEPKARPCDASVLFARLLPLLEDERICAQLDRPLTAPRALQGHGHSQGSRSGPDPISYADTAITLPAPRIDESERSYAPRRRASNGALMPLALGTLLLGGGAFGYLRYAPLPRAAIEQAPRAPALPAAQPEVLPQASSAIAAAQVAGTQVGAPLGNMAAPSAQPEQAEIESQTSPARAARTPHATSRSRNTSRRVNPARDHSAGTKHDDQPLPLPDADPAITQRAANPALESQAAPTPNEPPPVGPSADVAWDRIDAQLQAVTEPAEPQPEPEPAPEPSGDPAAEARPDAPGEAAPEQRESQPPAPSVPSAPSRPAEQPAPRQPDADQMPTPIDGEGRLAAPAAPTPEVDSLPPPEPPASL